MILLTLACETVTPTLIGPDPSASVTPPSLDSPAEGLVFEHIDTLPHDATPRTAGDIDGDGDEDLIGLTTDQRVVVWDPEPRPLADRPPALEADDAWVHGLEWVDGEVLVSVHTRTEQVYDRFVVALDLNGGLTVRARAESFNVVADVDGDGLSEHLFYDRDGSWMELSGGDRLDLPPGMNGTWRPHAVALESGDVILLNDSGYGVHEVYLLDLATGATEHLHLYASNVATDGDADHYATELVVSTWDTRLRFVDGAFEPFAFGDLSPMLAGNLDGHGGADLLSWDDTTLGMVSDGADLSAVSVEGLEQPAWHAVVADLDGDGLDDLVLPTWDQDGGVDVKVYANLTP